MSISKFFCRSSEISEFLISVFASFLAARMEILALSTSAFASFANSLLRSSVRTGILIIIDSPLFIGFKPKLATKIAFSISDNIPFSQGWTVRVLPSGEFILAT